MVPTLHVYHDLSACTELAKTVCPRLRDSAYWRSGEITQPRTHFFAQLCMYDMSIIICWLAPRDPERSLDPFQILESNHAVLAIMYL